MPHILVSSQLRLESGPTIVGDEFSDPDLMSKLGAVKTVDRGNNFNIYICDKLPRQVLDDLEKLGYTLVGAGGVGQTFVWTMHKPSSEL